MHGITLTKAPMDWEILQQENGYADIELQGSYQVHEAALKVGVESAIPVVRIVQEENNKVIIPWTVADHIHEMNHFSGTFSIRLLVPQGGLYRIDTSLETKSVVENLTWLYRGDCILHIGVGNLFIIAGQSNASGYSRDYIQDEPHLCVHLFRNRGIWDLASHPMNESTAAGSLPNEEMGIPGPSPYLSFAKELYEFTKCPVGLIQTALGGSSIVQWNPDTGDLYQNMLRKMKETGKNYKGILWYQGCSDTEPEKGAQYYDNFKQLVLSIREFLGKTIPFFTFQLNRQFNGLHNDGWGMVREAQRKAAEDLKNVYILSTTNCSLCDGIHNTAQANVVLGKKLAEQYKGTFLGGKAFFSPELQNITLLEKEEKEHLKIEGIWLKLSYKNVQGSFLVFSTRGEESGFALSDENGDNPVLAIRSNRQDKFNIYLEVQRQPLNEIFVSFAWEAYPVVHPLIDEVTCLPPLSCYKRKFKLI